jgi:hypothetical protein
MSVIHYGQRRIHFFPDVKTGKPDTSRGIFLVLRGDESCLVKILLRAVFDDNHPYSLKNEVKLPVAVYLKPFNALNEDEQLQLIWRTQVAVDEYLVDKRLKHRTDKRYPLSFVNSHNLDLIFG